MFGDFSQTFHIFFFHSSLSDSVVVSLSVSRCILCVYWRLCRENPVCVLGVRVHTDRVCGTR